MIAPTSSTGRFRFLLVDDDPDIHELVAGLLMSLNADLVSAIDGNEAAKLALNQRVDMILLDYEMPGLNGLEVLSRLRSEGLSESVPVIFITGNSSHRVLSQCFQAGAVDYIHKPFCVPEFRARIVSVMERQRLMRQMEHQATHDPLTNLCNRSAIRAKIQAAIDCKKENNSAVLFLDFDRFKTVNDSLGHNIGDLLLQQIAERLRIALRGSNNIGYLSSKSVAARLGGDEFVVLLEYLRDPDDAILVADRIISALEDPYFLAGQRVCSTASIGVVKNVQDYRSPDDALRDADMAMYEAKSGGAGRYVLFHPAMQANAEDRLRIENELRNAITNGELSLVYQPIMSMETPEAKGFEALIRWNHPTRGLLLPNVFLPIAEESGLIVELGDWILDQACQDFARWKRALGSEAPTNLHVNISRKQLLRDLVDGVKNAIKKYEILPACLHLEITESEIMQSPGVAKAAMNDLRKLGVKIAMDNFGMGQSSLSCLQDLPIDVLKIHKSFVANMEKSRSFVALVHSVTMLGKNLGLTVISEGIETADQLAMLQFMACDFGQGRLFSEPMSSNKVASFLEFNSLQLHPPLGRDQTKIDSTGIELTCK